MSPNTNNKVINANKVVVNESKKKKKALKKQNQNKKNNGNKKKTVNEKKKTMEVAQPSSNIKVPAYLNKSNVSDWAFEWLKAYISPCTETGMKECALRIPDAAMPYSATPYQRLDMTFRFPFQNKQNVDLTGLNYSMLIFQIPNFRNAVIVIGNRLAEEFGSTNVKDILTVLNNLSTESAVYPNFVTGELTTDDIPHNYVTIVRSTALDTIPLPDDEGVSPVISQLRLSFNGLTVGHNTPTLFNQATCSGMVINARSAGDTYTDTDAHRAFYINLHLGYVPPSGQQTVSWSVTIDSPGDPPLLGAFNLAPFGGASSDYVATHVVRGKDGSLILNIGDTYRYSSVVLVAGVTYRVSLVNVTVPNRTLVLGDGVLNNARTDVIRVVYVPDDEDVTGFENAEVDLITLPPLQQADMSQTVPNTSIFLMKDGGGCYMPTFKFTPIFEPSSVNFRRQKFTTFGFSSDGLHNAKTGIIDHIDLNFGIGVINIQSMPYAAQPLIKFRRAHQIIPASGSFFGLFTTNDNAKDTVALEIADCIKETQVHLHPASDNFLDTLVKCVFGAVNLLPKMLMNMHNVAETVQHICETVGNGATRMKNTSR